MSSLFVLRRKAEKGRSEEVREIYENCIEKDNYILYNIIKVSFFENLRYSERDTGEGEEYENYRYN